MRIAITNWSRRRAGGVETYLAGLLPRLARRGHTVAMFYETEAPSDREPVVEEDAIAWFGPFQNEATLKAALDPWRADVIYAHGFRDARLDRVTTECGPVAWFTHQYTGTCIDGAKTHKFPTVQPCDRMFGKACLGQYFPRRCGGWNPWTMWRLYQEQSFRQESLRRCRVLLTHSAHMEQEYLRHGFEGKVRRVPFPAEIASAVGGEGKVFQPPWRLLFLGRMEPPKGGQVLIRALERCMETFEGGVELVMAGDGTHRAEWEAMARAVTARHSRCSIRFTGWVGEGERACLLESAHCLVVPSLWPEPFGLAGPEAACLAVPSVGFHHGGISEWLQDDVTGVRVVAGKNPEVALAKTLTLLLNDPARMERLSRGAREHSSRFSWERHLAALDAIFKDIL